MELLSGCTRSGRRLARLALLAASACVPHLDVDESTVREPRVLAIIAEPAESAPTSQQKIQYTALVADEHGVRSDLSLAWYQCLAQKPLAELGPVSKECLRNGSPKLASLGVGEAVEGTLPTNACSLFGPNPPPPVQGQPPGRPVDADESGGYKLPLIVGLNSELGSEVVLYEQRISCGLANVSPDISVAFAQRYHANQNPRALALQVTGSMGTRSISSQDTLDVASNEQLAFSVSWPSCPASDVCGDGVCGPDETSAACAADCQKSVGCGGQERYLDLDRERLELIVRRESLRVAWYATTGTYDQARTGVSDADLSGVSSNRWRAPAQPGPASLWLVLRDSRGGVGFLQIAVTVH